jgi:hypothetical protein
MTKSIESSELRTWALKGAEQRLVEIATEAAAIHRAFPELREKGAGGAGQRENGRPGRAARGTNGSGTPAAARKGRKFTAAQRKAFGDRMRKYWAERKAAAQSAAPQENGRAATSGVQATRVRSAQKKR